MKRNVTSLGQFLRILRIRNGEVLFDMAKKLEVSSSFLSAVEYGDRGVPKSWVEILTEKYSLDEEKQNELVDAITRAKSEIQVSLKDKSSEDIDLAITFARSFDSLTDEKKQELRKIFDIN